MRITQALVSHIDKLVATPLVDADKESFSRLVAHDILENQILYKDVASIIMGYVKETPEDKEVKKETMWKLYEEIHGLNRQLSSHRFKTKSHAVYRQCTALINYLAPKLYQLINHPLISDRVSYRIAREMEQDGV